MFGIPLQLIGWILAGLACAAGAVAMIVFGPRIVGLLIVKYLRRRRIAWVSLLAVTLCTTMVLVVISVMGGWLDMFENSSRGLSGDLIVRTSSLAGFSGYEEMIKRIDQLPSVAAAVPTLETYGLLNVGGRKVTGVQVFGIPIDQIGKVNDFPDSLWRQHQEIVDRLKEIAILQRQNDRDASANPAERAKTHRQLAEEASRLQEKLRQPPSFKPVDPVSQPAVLPEGIKLSASGDGKIETGDAALDAKIFFVAFPPDSRSGQLFARVPLTDAEADTLRAFSGDKHWQRTVTQLARESNYPGLIASTGVLEIRKNEKGETVGRDAFKYRLIATLSMLGISPDGQIDPNNRADESFRIVDDSHTGMFQNDMESVYVPFDVLQKDLGMNALQATNRFTGQPYTEPARTSEIHIRLRPGADIQSAQKAVQAAVDAVVARDNEARLDRGEPVSTSDDFARVRVMTWRETAATFINAIQNEKVLMVVLFGIISLVAVFLIFCIFYMIVAEKTRDIGIIKSVGASNLQVAGIFLGYGLAIGLVGGGMGLLASYLIVHNINWLHTKMGQLMGIQIWNPQVYAFDTIPNTMEPRATAIIVLVAVLSSVLGAIIPARAAARLHPADALRGE